MEKQYELQETTVGDFVAEELELEARLMPTSHRADADILRKEAELLRENNKKVIRILREVPPK